MSELHKVGMHREVPWVTGHGGLGVGWVGMGVNVGWAWVGVGWVWVWLRWRCWSIFSLLPCDFQDPFFSKVIPFRGEKARPEGNMNFLLLMIQDS